MLHKFSPVIQSVAQIDNSALKADDIKYEPMIFSGDLDFTLRNSGNVTRHVIDQVLPAVCDFYTRCNLPNGYNIVIDTRTNMLMKGYYPSIPGWHCDDVPRGCDGQPWLAAINRNVQHFMLLLSPESNHENGVSGTEFVCEEKWYDINPDAVWHSLNSAVNADKSKKTRKVKAGEVVRFDQYAIHRASPASSNGWRYFFRLSVTHRKPANEIRKQTQIYVDLNDVGW